MVLTTTGAAKAVGNALPELKGILTASAIRVPTPNVSLAIMLLNLKTAVNVKDLNHFLRNLSLESKQIDYSASTEVASSDFVGNRCSGIVDSKSTTVQGNRINLYVWYDNEFGYSCQVVRVLQQISGIIHPKFPAEEDATHIVDDE